MNPSEGHSEFSPQDEALDSRLRMAFQAVSVPSHLPSKLAARVRQECQEYEEQHFPVQHPEAQQHADAQQFAVQLSASGDPAAVTASASSAGEVGSEGSPSGEQNGDVGGESEVETGNILPFRRSALRWLVRGSWAAALAVMVIWGARVWLGGYVDAGQLAAFCVSELETLDAGQNWQVPSDLSPALQRLLHQHLDLSAPEFVGRLQLPASEFGTACEVWKISERRGAVYVFMFDEPPSVGRLSTQLRVIQDSGEWNLAARSSPQVLTVVACRGDVRRYFKPYSFA